MSGGRAAQHDAIIIGAGPAGSICAAHLAQGGRRVLLLEKARFPRDKVCGDCLNPSVLPLLDRLGLRAPFEALPHVAVEEICYRGIDSPVASFPVPARSEFVVKRRDLDDLLVRRAVELGAEFCDGLSVTRLEPGWTVEAGGERFTAPLVFAADGRNSTAARLAGRLPNARRERTAIQCHCARPPWHGNSVQMLFYREGYGGTAPVSETELNLCLVASPANLSKVRQRAEREFELPSDIEWRTTAPLLRADAREIAKDGLFLLGDAARVVEPFTGEGIYYAMRSGELAAQAILGGSDAEAAYRRGHREMYRGRLWINRVARLACLHPRLTSLALRVFRHWPAPLGALTAKVVGQT